MARVKNPLMSQDARGKIGNVVFEKTGKTNYCKINKTSKKPPSTEQQSRRKKWGEGIEVWRSLTDEQKQVWKDYAKGKKGNGFNYFMQDFMVNLQVGVYGVSEYNYCVY